jgi:hypothetical protein
LTLNEHNTAKKWLLAAASYFFYAFWNASYMLILLASSLVNFALALPQCERTGSDALPQPISIGDHSSCLASGFRSCAGASSAWKCKTD